MSRLSQDDIFAGTALVILALICIFAYIIEFLAIIKAQLLHRFAGFRFILAANLADIISLLFYGIWAGLVILTKNVMLPLEWKDWLSVIMDTTW